MTGLPDPWRIELLHPAVVHFPIALLICGAVARVAGGWVAADGRWGFLLPAGRLALAVGAVFAWLAVWTGDLANAEVARTLCDPRVKRSHEELAYWVSGVFTGAVVVDLAALRLAVEHPLRRLAGPLVALALLGGAGLMGYVGHLGGQLVYQQGAGVYQPSPTCAEFE